MSKELDMEVAEYVMGYFASIDNYRWHDAAGYPHVRRKDSFQPSTDIGAAMEVENRIVELGITRAYCDELYIVVAGDKSNEQLGAFRFDLIHATAEQRCRAALATVSTQRTATASAQFLARDGRE